MTTRALADVPIKFAGIPCIARVTTYRVVPPWKGSAMTAPSDMDYYGYTEIEYELLDQRGRPAPWLEAKRTNDAEERAEEQIKTYMDNEQRESQYE